jgi:1L-myo-inositol 1-phosphate cytidylyltransferase
MKKPISEAVILMAGSGSRLRRIGETSPKPLLSLGGRPLISYTLAALVKAGVKTIYAVIGFESDLLRSGIMALIPAETDFVSIENPEWQKQNGVSLLAASNSVKAPFFLTMGDHIFDDSIVDLLQKNSKANELTLAVDRKLDRIFDLDDAMKARTHGDRLIAIGKDLEEYDAIDIGLFVCPGQIFEYLERAKHDGDCSLADGVRLMAAAGRVRAIDIGGAWWQDIDTPEMLAAAEKVLSGSRHRLTPGPSVP